MKNFIEVLDQLDRSVFLFLNGMHSSTSDTIMWWITDPRSWIPMYLVIIGGIIWKFRLKSIFIVLGIALTITFADQISTRGFKKNIKRYGCKVSLF